MMVQTSRSMPAARHSFVIKIGAGAAMLGAADVLLYGVVPGAVLGVFGLLWVAVLSAVRQAVVGTRSGVVALAFAGLMGVVQIDDPSLLGTILFLIAIGSATLLPGHVFDHVGRWFVRLAALGARGPLRAPTDAIRALALPSRSRSSPRTMVEFVALPLIGGALFLTLFANANPILGKALGSIRLPDGWAIIGHLILWAFVLSLVWPTLRPRAIRLAPATSANVRVPALRAPTLTFALVVFNAVFALQNALDLIFLWSGAGLPDGVTLADYAHRGAYTLIITALLAAAFVLVAFGRDGAAPKTPALTVLVVAWIAQNLLLVASSALRLIDYIDTYSLTTLRIAALAWMALVATGLVLIWWRLLAVRSAAWLINSNALAAATVLFAASLLDLGAIAATWNVRHLHDPAKLDLCYLQRQGSSALIPVIALRDAPIGPRLREQAVYVSRLTLDRLQEQQSDWRRWTWRGARRLAHARTLLANDRRSPLPAPHGRDCGGEMLPPPFVAPAAPLPSPAAPPVPGSTSVLAQPMPAPSDASRQALTNGPQG